MKEENALMLEAAKESADAFLHLLGEMSKHIERLGAAEYLSLAELGVHMGEASVAAARGDWTTLTKQMIEADTAAANLAAFGVPGALRGVWDAYAALQQMDGYEVKSSEQHISSAFLSLQDKIVDGLFSVFNQDAVADVRVNPYGEAERKNEFGGGEETLRNPQPAQKASETAAGEAPSTEAASIGENTHSSHIHHHSHSGSEPMIPFDPSLITFDIPISESSNKGRSEETIPSGDLLFIDLESSEPLSSMNQGEVFSGSFGAIHGDSKTEVPFFDPGGFAAIVPGEYSVPELSGWCGTEAFADHPAVPTAAVLPDLGVGLSDGGYIAPAFDPAYAATAYDGGYTAPAFDLGYTAPSYDGDVGISNAFDIPLPQPIVDSGF